MAVSVVGFDIGSLTSYIGVARGGGVEVITNEYSERATPTCVAFSGELVLVGTAAKLQQVMNIQNTFTSFTRLLGKCLSDSSVVNERKFITHQVESTRDGRITLSAFLKGQKTPFAPEQILAIQMNKLKEIAETTIGSKVVDVVVNVPTYYTDAERRSVLDATKVAGLNCVKLVNDITAIGTAYGFYHTDLPPADQQPKIVAFVSVGYSTTQVGICSFNTGKMKVLATTCDAFLGGRDFDERLFNKFASEFQQQYKLKGSLSSKATIRLLQECEKLKKSMSANSSELPINVESLAEDRDLANKMKRTDFEELCSDLLQRFQMLITKCLDVAKLKTEDVHSVELIGGSSRIPMIKNVVASVFKQEGKTSLNADEAVARGCAFQETLLQVFTEPRKIKLKMRMNTHGIFNISQAQLIEEYEKEVEVSVSEDNPAVDGPPNSKEEVTTASNGDTESQNPPVDSNQTNMQDSTSPKKKTVIEKEEIHQVS
ncbi:heat shock protein 110kDa [Schistosoma bovis]|uniref:Heat shock protein 110kDa n=1 Tax=Schistosoma bovis TaxID=6184 RepID=A0A430PYI6_SCHBO|nr:heat shock protein 110kDa [Schistosoma bovis]